MAQRIVEILCLVLFGCGTVLVLQGNIRGRLRSRPSEESSAVRWGRRLREKTQTADFRKTWRNDRIDREIYEGLSMLQNLILAHSGELNADFIISELAGRDGLLKETYLKMLSLLRTGHEKEAEKVMREAADTEAGREFASLLGTWEYLKPEQLSKSIESYRISIREACVTRQKKKDALISDFIYFPATANVFLVFMNFIYISYFMEQKEMFQMIF